MHNISVHTHFISTMPILKYEESLTGFLHCTAQRRKRLPVIYCVSFITVFLVLKIPVQNIKLCSQETSEVR